jgi:hypothetical protein
MPRAPAAARVVTDEERRDLLQVVLLYFERGTVSITWLTGSTFRSRAQLLDG